MLQRLAAGLIALVALAVLVGLAARAEPGSREDRMPERTRLRTGGFDYDANAARRDAAWLARHHDLIVGVQNHGAGRAFDAADPRTVRALRAANPRTEILAYVPYQTVMPWMRAFMEDWARDRGRDPEDLWCHYAVDTTVKLRDGSEATIPGFPDGSATRRADSRVPSTWWKGAHPNVCPWSPLFRDAFTALVRRAVDLPGARLDGVFLDSFAGTLDRPFDLRLENTVELRALGAADPAAARRRAADALAASVPALARALREALGRDVRVMPNAGDVDDVYHWHKELFSDRFGPGYDDFGIEYLITPGHARQARIPRLKAAYDDLADRERPVRLFFTSHTTTREPAPDAFEQMILAVHYLLQHERATFSFHRGGAGWYGALGGRFSASHWHRNLEVDLGRPLVREGPDAWSARGTDRFFVAAEGPDHTVLARAFERGIVLAKFGREAGLALVGTRRDAVPLGGTYRRLLPDNRRGPPVTSVELGWGEGAILLRDGS